MNVPLHKRPIDCLVDSGNKEGKLSTMVMDVWKRDVALSRDRMFWKLMLPALMLNVSRVNVLA